MALLETVERETGPNPEWTVIWLHGLGADGNDFVPILPALVGPGWPAMRFVFPHAPIRPVTLNGGVPMRAWYDIRDLTNISDRVDAQGMCDAIGQVDALIAREADRGLDASRVVLAGFSQGGAVALAAASGRTAPVAGVIALSTYLPLSAEALAHCPEEATAQPVFMAHGQRDPVVPIAMAEASRDALRRAGFAVEWHTFPMAHEVCPPEIDALGDWLTRVVCARSRS